MRERIPINLAVEDTLSGAILRRILIATGRPFEVGTCYQRHGFGYLKRTIIWLNSAARGTPFVVLTDLDTGTCVSDLITDWLRIPRHPNLIFRVAVREVEAWVLADRRGFAEFAGVREKVVPRDPEAVANPKQRLIAIVARSRYRSLRQDIVPRQGNTAQQGPNYNAPLIKFVQDRWDPLAAQRHCDSLRRAINRLRTFRPTRAK